MIAGRVVLLAGEGAPTNAVYHALARAHGDLHVIIEARPSRRQMLRRRVQRLGLLRVAGQLAFMALVEPVLRRRAAARLAQIVREYGLDLSRIPVPVTHVPSANSAECRDLLRATDPSVVVVNGTRILSGQTLSTLPGVPFINMHMGITPLYRGVHGGYWACYEARHDLVGTTVHLVDEGIDTGSIIGQPLFVPTKQDSFATYPYLHLGTGIPALLEAVRTALDGTLTTRQAPPLASRLRSHPTVVQYLAGRLRRGVR